MSKAESADLILKLYDLRREATMREARSWVLRFSPESTQEVLQAIQNPETSAFYRMVASYWEMAASFVNHGAIDEEMFGDANGEHFVVFSKIEPFLSELREITGSPKMLGNLEKLIMRQPNAQERLAKARELTKRMKEAHAKTT